MSYEHLDIKLVFILHTSTTRCKLLKRGVLINIHVYTPAIGTQKMKITLCTYATFCDGASEMAMIAIKEH